MKCFVNRKHFTTKKLLKIITYFLGDDNHKEVVFNGEILTFTLQVIKIWTDEGAFRNLKLIVIAYVKTNTLVQKNIVG